MSTPHHDNEPYIVDKHFDAAFKEARDVIFSGSDFIGFLPSIGEKFMFELMNAWDGQSCTFQPAKSKVLDGWNCKKPLRSGFHSLANRYIAKIKGKGKKTARAVQLDLPDLTPKPVLLEGSEVEPEICGDWEQAENSSAWDVWICRRTKEIHLYHRPTMTRTESNFHPKGFYLGPVTVERETCRNKKLVEMHRSKCFETTYRILSGRL